VGRFDAAFKRQEREALKRQRDLARFAKEQAKFSALEQARLQVAENENAIELLLSVHKEQSAPIDWERLASSLRPHRPARRARHELAVHLSFASALEQTDGAARLKAIEEACAQDDQDYAAALVTHDQNVDAWQWLRGICQRVLSGEMAAYEQVLTELSPLREISSLGSSSVVTVHNAKIATAELRVNGRDVVPTEIKSLTSTGKVSAKGMPKSRFHEIYQDYVCGCALRVARELFAALPFETVLVTACVARSDASDGEGLVVPVLSALSRDACTKLDFDQLDPSDTIATLLHRGDVKASKKSGDFVPITPLIPSDAVASESGPADIAATRSNVRLLRGSIRQLLRLPPIDHATSEVASGVLI